MYLADLEEDQVRTSSRPLSVLIAFVLLTSPCVLVLEHHCCYPLEKKKGGHEPVVCRILVAKDIVHLNLGEKDHTERTTCTWQAQSSTRHL